MRLIDSNTANALTGSRSGESLTVSVWYVGRLAYPDPLPVSNARFSWDRDRQVQTFECTVADPDGLLAPWLLEDPLGVGGAGPYASPGKPSSWRAWPSPTQVIACFGSRLADSSSNCLALA